MIRGLFAEFLGTAGLVIVVIGSGIMGDTLADGHRAIALLANSLATGAGLFALIQIFGPISGAHFNPAVSFFELLSKRMSIKEFAGYIFVQMFGGLSGVVITHLMFGQVLVQFSQQDRAGFQFLFSEVIATLGLVLVVGLSRRKNADAISMSIAFYITAAYWCTSSTSFANPAVTIARSFTNTFTGIHWMATPGFIVAQLLGAVLGVWVCKAFDR